MGGFGGNRGKEEKTFSKNSFTCRKPRGGCQCLVVAIRTNNSKTSAQNCGKGHEVQNIVRAKIIAYSMEWFSFFTSRKCPKKRFAIVRAFLHVEFGHLGDYPKMGVCRPARAGRI
eukprot:261485-Amphidinium_carterae.1